jgi:hypothetical protein
VRESRSHSMRFVIVSDSTPRTYSVCAHCAKPIDVGYLRELTSNFPYCDYACYRGRELALGCWPFAGFDNFAFVGLQLTEERVLRDAYTN